MNALSERAQELSRVLAFRVVFSVLEIGARYAQQSAQSCIDGTVTTEPPVALELRAHWHCRLLHWTSTGSDAKVATSFEYYDQR